MSWLSKATGIHIGGNWGISKAINKGWGALPVSNFAKGAKDRFSNLYAGDFAGAITGVAKSDIENAAKSGEAQALKEALRKAHDNEVASLGAAAAEAIRNRRRKGLYATILTGSGPTMGSPASSSGKQTLGA